VHDKDLKDVADKQVLRWSEYLTISHTGQYVAIKKTEATTR